MNTDEIFQLTFDNFPRIVEWDSKTYYVTEKEVHSFMREIGRFRKTPISSSKKTVYKGLVEFLKKQAAELNQKNNVVPYIDKNYSCDTCGSKDGKCMPNSGLCYHCHTDNWKREHEI